MSTGAPSLMAVGRDTAALASQLGLDGYAVFGSSGGAPFAVASAVADPGAVRALGSVGGIGPWRLLDPPSANPGDRARLALLDAGDLAGAWARMHRSAEDQFGGLDVDAAAEEILSGDASALVHDERYRAVWADNMHVVLKNFDGYTLDNLAWGATWDVDPREVAAPSLLWYGALDHHCPPAHGQWYADRIANAELIVFPDGGHFDVIDAHWPEVLAGLLSIWGSA
jgi:pimeloyl-ACP methyl ester carboxylesterase